MQRFNNSELDTRLFELRHQGPRVSIEPQTYDVLAYLLSHRDRVVSKQELLDQLWQGRIVSESGLKTCVKEVRKAVNDNGQGAKRIRPKRCLADIKWMARPVAIKRLQTIGVQ
jgi:DNA-binding winged helix-turn-helix (wHTH) protein